MQLNNKKILSSLITTILIISVLAFPVPQTQASNVTVLLNNKAHYKATVGETVVVNGTNPTPGGLVRVYWRNLADENLLAEVYSEAVGYGNGQYSTEIEVPVAARGNYTIVVLDVQSGDTGVATLEVIPSIELSPDTALPGDTVTVTGQGFAANANLTSLYVGAENVTPSETVSIDENGTFTCTFEVPSLTYGDYNVTATDTDGNSAKATLTVWATISLSPTSGPSGTVVSITGEGFTPKGNVTIVMNTTTCEVVETIQADSDGAFSGQFVVPTLDVGTYIVNASDEETYATGEFEVTGTTVLKVSPSAVAPGDTVTVKGYNFTAMADVPVTIDFGSLASYASANTTADGTFEVNITVPDVQVDTYSINATDNYGLNATTTLKVAITTLTVLPTSGPTGTRVHIVGGGFTEGTEFNVTIGDELLVLASGYTNETSSTGTIDVYAYIPTVEVGTYVITVVDDTGIKAERTFTVTGTTQITVTPSSAPENYTVSIALEYFTAAGDANTSVSLAMYNVTADGEVDWIYSDLWSNISITADEGYANGQVDKTGTYKGSFVVPQIDVGDYIINATDANGLKAQVSFKVVLPTVIVVTGADEYMPGDRVSFFAKCTYSYSDQVINLYTPEGYKISIPIDVTTKLGDYYTGTASYIIPSDADLGAWTWNSTIAGVTVKGEFTVVEKPTTAALSADVSKLKEDVADLASLVEELSTTVTAQASDIDKLTQAVSDLKSAVSDLSSALSSLKEDVSNLSTAVSNAQSAAEKASEAAEAAQGATSTISMAVYGAVILSLIAAVAAIMSIVILQRKIAG